MRSVIFEIRSCLRKIISEKGVYNVERKDLMLAALDCHCSVAEVQKQMDYFLHSRQTMMYRGK